jgi:arylsulfatase A-like enzyme
LFLLTDDQRWDTLGCVGNRIINTPTIDRIATRGVRFENAFVTTAICCASRASILTGMYTRTHGIDDFTTPLPGPLADQTFTSLLHRAGYRTGFIGKWGLGGELPANEFDYFRGFAGQGKYFPEPNDGGRHITLTMGDQAIEFIDGCASNTPFCLSVSFKAPHVQDDDPRQFLYDPALKNMYSGIRIPRAPASREEDFTALPEFVQESEGRVRWYKQFASETMYEESVRSYYRLISGVDQAVARIIEALERAGLTDNTVVLFTSDNGMFLGEHGMAGKWLMYEESIRVPMIVYDPRNRPRRSVRDDMVLNIDIAPTILDFAEIAAPRNMQGRSMLPLLGLSSPSWRKEWFYEHHFGNTGDPYIPACEGVRGERYKYARYVDREPEEEFLYDLRRDPHELDGAISRNRDELRARWNEWRTSLKPWNDPAAETWKEPV